MLEIIMRSIPRNQWHRLVVFNSSQKKNDIFDIIIIITWALFVGYPYVSLDETLIPAGREFPSHIQSHHMWIRAMNCGLCALWNGSSQGGAPMLVDVHGSMLHPFVIIATFIFGVVNGAKMSILAALVAAGLAQIWLGRLMGVSRGARLWTALIAVSGGHLLGRMENGVVGIVLATASCSLALPALIDAVTEASGRRIALLAVTLYLVATAGQGYMQIGFVALIPLTLLIVSSLRDVATAAKTIAKAIVIAVFLDGMFILPFLHFFYEFSKDSDLKFQSGQPFAYVPLNLVIDNIEYYRSNILGKLPFPNLYTIYIGWIPVIFAIVGVFAGVRDSRRRIKWYLMSFGLCAMWISSASPLLWLINTIPIPALTQQIVSIRYPTYISGLAVPALLVIAGLGFDRVVALVWPSLSVSFESRTQGFTAVNLSSRWALLPVLAISLGSTYSFTKNWTSVQRLDPGVSLVLSEFVTDRLQWVGPPFGEHFWSEVGTGLGLKMYQGVRPWKWAGRELPLPVMEANRSGVPNGMSLKSTVSGVPIYSVPSGREYASIVTSSGTEVTCVAKGSGGNIDVACPASAGGRLIVRENMWSGWGATINGNVVIMNSGQWLSIDLPSGPATVKFRYRPWDAFLGFALMLLGCASVVRLWLRQSSSPVFTLRPVSPLGKTGPGEQGVTATP